MQLSIRSRFFLFTTLLLLVFPNLVRAHEIKPAIVDLNFTKNATTSASSQLSIDIVVNIESLMADIGPDHEDTDSSENSSVYKHLRAMDDISLLSEFQNFQVRFISEIQISDSRENKIPLTLKSVSIPAVGDVNVPRDTRITLLSTLPKSTTAVKWQWNTSFGEIIVRANSNATDLDYAVLLSPGQPTDLIQFTEELVA